MNILKISKATELNYKNKIPRDVAQIFASLEKDKIPEFWENYLLFL